jgi:hypothetical protein
MDSLEKMDVGDWQDFPPALVVEKRAPRRFLSPTLIGILGTLLLHALVIQSVPWSSGPKVKPPETPELVGVRSRSKNDSKESLVLLSLSTMAVSNQAAAQKLSSLPDFNKMKIKSTVDADPPAMLNIDVLALSEDQTAGRTSGSGDAAELAQLFGIYTSQIQARIDRVWRRPRTPINEDNTSATNSDLGASFQCQAQIVQDAAGNVQEVLLPRCNGSAAWQRSLVLAIQHASPLPAPPSAKVFTKSISLNFVGLAYVSGSSDDDYEIDLPRSFARE